jgi:hypothetical protein
MARDNTVGGIRCQENPTATTATVVNDFAAVLNG